MWLASNRRGNAATILLTFERRSRPSFGEFRLLSCATPLRRYMDRIGDFTTQGYKFPYALLDR
jgi:hypothetical protein